MVTIGTIPSGHRPRCGVEEAIPLSSGVINLDRTTTAVRRYAAAGKWQGSRDYTGRTVRACGITPD